MPWTTPQDVKDLWPDNAPETPPSDAKLAKYIEVIETQILQRYKTIQERIDNNTLNVNIIVFNTATWIIEYCQRGSNPYTQESQSYTGAASRSITFEAKWRKSLILTSDDLDVFMPMNQGKAFSIDMAPNLTTPDVKAPEYLGWDTTVIY